MIIELTKIEICIKNITTFNAMYDIVFCIVILFETRYIKVVVFIMHFNYNK